VTSDMKQNYR